MNLNIDRHDAGNYIEYVFDVDPGVFGQHYYTFRFAPYNDPCTAYEMFKLAKKEIAARILELCPQTEPTDYITFLQRLLKLLGEEEYEQDKQREAVTLFTRHLENF